MKSSKIMYFNICSNNWHSVSVMGHKHVFEPISTEIDFAPRAVLSTKFIYHDVDWDIEILCNVLSVDNWQSMCGSQLFDLRSTYTRTYPAYCMYRLNRIVCPIGKNQWRVQFLVYTTYITNLCTVLSRKYRNKRKKKYIFSFWTPIIILIIRSYLRGEWTDFNYEIK